MDRPHPHTKNINNVHNDMPMGKKSTASSGKAPKSSPEETTNNGLTGVFAADFVELLGRQGLPHDQVEIRSLHKTEAVAESCDTPEDQCGPASTSPFSVLVDYEDAEDQSTLKSLHIRNWLLSERVLSAMTEALASCSHLTSISLWNVGLSKPALQQISQLVIQQKIKQITLDGNDVCSASVIELIGLKSSVEHLSMKCCEISDTFLAEISSLLAENKSLVHLNLSCNKIGDDGANSLATSLRLNRTLLSLALTNNHIGDAGALSLSNVLSRFELNHSEIVLRRKLLSLQERSEDGMSSVDLDKKEAGVRRSPSVSSVETKGKGATGKDKGQPSKGASKKADSKKEEKGKKDDKAKRGSDSKRSKGKDSKASKKAAEPPPESPKPEPHETINPLLDVPLEKEQDRLFIPGNTTLAYLTLAFNRIGEDGVHAFLNALKIQEQYSQFGSGLLKLSLHHNLASDKSQDMYKLNELLTKKNPLQPATGDCQLLTESS